MCDFRGANPPQGASCNVERLPISDWQTQIDKLMEDHEGITHERYAAGLAAFRAWYLQSYSDEPDAALLTDDEVRDYRVCLTGVKGYKAATVNVYLAPIRALVRAQGRTLKVKSVKQVQGPVETLDACDLGRLINVVDGPQWSDKRDVALINVMARAGLRVSEALALKVGDVELGPRFGDAVGESRQRIEGKTTGAIFGGHRYAEGPPPGAAQGRRRSAVSQSDSSRA